MTAFVECGVCGVKLIFDTSRPIHPESEGWTEIPVCEVGVKEPLKNSQY